MAGYSISGRAWGIMIPASSPLHGDGRFNNLFEFLGSAVTVWLEVLDCPKPSECILALGDSTSALGWIDRSGRVKDDSMSYRAIQNIVRHLATLLLQSNHCLATQHLKGDYNVVADLLSYSGTVRGKTHPLGRSSFANRQIIFASRQEEGHGAQDRIKEGLCLTPSSLLYPAEDKNFSSGPSWDSTATQTGIKTANLRETIRDQWYRALCAVPREVWLR